MAKHFGGRREVDNFAPRRGGGHRGQTQKYKTKRGFKPRFGDRDQYDGPKHNNKFGGKPKFGVIFVPYKKQRKNFKKGPKPDKDSLAVEMSKYWEKAGNKDKANEAAHALDNDLLEYKKKAEEQQRVVEEKKSE